jgi:hypothetical protein
MKKAPQAAPSTTLNEMIMSRIDKMSRDFSVAGDLIFLDSAG